MRDERAASALQSTSDFSKRLGRPSSLAPATALVDLRRARGWTLKDLAGAGGPTQAISSQLERGLVVPQPKHLEALSRAYGVPVGSWRIRFVLETEAQ